MNIIDLVAMGLLKETQDEAKTDALKEVPEIAENLCIARWNELGEDSKDFWRDQAGNLPVSEERVCETCRWLRSTNCLDKQPAKTLKQMIEETQE